MIGKVKRFIENVRSETSLQDELAELRRQLDLSKEASQLQQLGHSLKNDIQSSVDEIDYSFYDRPSSDQIRRQHNEANEANINAHTVATPAPQEEDDLAKIQRPTFGRELYEELPPWYHEKSDGSMTPKVPTAPEPVVAQETSVSNVSATNPVSTHS